MAAGKKAMRTAASILLLRPRKKVGSGFTGLGPEDYEVLMLERSDKRGSFNGAVVFPGGVVDESDHANAWANFLGLSRTTHQHNLKLGALRELFEETGVLLSDPPINLSNETGRGLRARVQKDGKQFMEVCRELQVKPDLSKLQLIQRWITPTHVPVRFDTFFFLAVANSARGAEADGGEAVRVGWLPPSQYLKLYEEQQVSLLPPQYYQLSLLAGTHKLDEISKMSDATNDDDICAWQPVLLSNVVGGPGMCYPGDAAYPFELSPVVVNADARHRLYMTPIAKKQGSAAGKGMEHATGGAVMYELERTKGVPFGGDSWGGRRRKNDLSTSAKL